MAAFSRLLAGRFQRPGLAGSAALSVERRPWHPQVLLLSSVAGAVTGGILIVAVMLARPQGDFGADRYELWRWEAENIPSLAMTWLGIGPDGAVEGGSEAVTAYFRLTSQIRAELEQAEPDLARLAALEAERAGYENEAERVIEARMSMVLEDEGLERGLPLFSGVHLLWPPVAMELTSPPVVLVRSPRDRIERAGDTLLRQDLGLAAIETFEAATDDEDTVSLVVPIGGLAAYPAIVRDNRTYFSAMSTSAHEWVHHYLAFYPLGSIWGESQDGIALNETTANIAEREIARIVDERIPERFPDDLDGRGPPAPASTLDFNTELRTLRLEVDALLAEGRIDDAERIMNERRDYLEANGIFVRKINQAYFAFYGSYADSPASSDPIGPKVERVWELTGNLRRFLGVMRDVRSVAELDEALAILEALAGG